MLYDVLASCRSCPITGEKGPPWAIIIGLAVLAVLVIGLRIFLGKRKKDDEEE